MVQLSIPPARLPYLIPVLLLLLWLGLRNRPDPVWVEAGELLRQPHALVGEVPDSLQQLYCQLHQLPYRPGDSTALRLISRPYLSNIEWTAFKAFCQNAIQRRFMVVSGVTGVGATKQTKHLARLIAGRPDNLLQIDCAPQFDLEYHKKYIGYDDEKGNFVPGELLAFWERCRQHPEQHFVAVADNFDKINPETFFGPELWESLSSPRDTAVLGGRRVNVPPNFYFFSVTHLGPGSLIEMNEEHFKRLGRQYILDPNPRELLAWLQQQAQKLAGSPEPEAAARLAVLRDSAQMHRFVYYFLKSNQLLRKRYSDGYQLGQGSNVRQFYRPEDLSELKRTYLSHINALYPARPLAMDDFDALDYTVRSEGLEANSSFLARQIQYLQDTGYFVEITMVATTALLTFLAGWWVFRRREQLIRLYGDRALEVYLGFEKQLISAEVAGRRLDEIKNEVDNLVMRRRLNYTEGLYFLAFVEDKAKRIEFARNVSENFLELFNAFMDDNILTEGEYLKLRQFLQSIRHKIPAEIYDQFLEKVETTYAASN
ncbi:MAG: hypothetical protein IT260_11335 [Saprospiraceae bacterium]|nr:hypothetical protein [Saprospiraceae bacterium]